jgi:hypothetical protein
MRWVIIGGSKRFVRLRKEEKREAPTIYLASKIFQSNTEKVLNSHNQYFVDVTIRDSIGLEIT